MVESDPDPRCPECGGPIGATATYCMHCSADLTEELAAADIDGDGAWDQFPDDATGPEGAAGWGDGTSAGAGGESGGQLLDPDGLADNALTILVGIVGGAIAGLVGTVVLGVVTSSGYGVLFGIVAWLVTTAYLVRQRTVQGAVSKSGYAIALVLLLVPLVAFSPGATVDGSRGGLAAVLLAVVLVPATIAAVVGWVAGKFVPDEPSEGDGPTGGDAPTQ
ncbi:zinc ribbon domain-containing protein [Haloglomus litoreum]|uniref:zinc ribbon domain-containing protein n=1 Tax=Haloglomus litoreum TaxID=3034026 RepID=UPI0023E79589|nr:zinc ribbon domain-containing protein [Haloglomus sp. DT116]